MPAGRPTDYTPELAQRICDAVATSTLGLNKICLLHDDFPNPDSIYTWRLKYKEFSEKYTQAKRLQAELMAEEIIDISDDGTNDTYVDDEGNIKVDSDVIARSRLRVDSRKWIACKLAPKIYGDKVEHKHDGEVKITTQRVKQTIEDLNVL